MDFRAAKSSYNALKLVIGTGLFGFVIVRPLAKIYLHEKYKKDKGYPQVFHSALWEGIEPNYYQRVKRDRVLKFQDGRHEDIHLQ